MPTAPEHQSILDRLQKDLPSYLRYHTLEHTLDVFDCARRIGIAENINEQDMRLLLTAAAYHDSGYIYQSAGHERKSCEIAKKELVNFGYSDADITTVCGLIMATEVPQQPKTPLEQIICDADLDYLGRDDFHELGSRLYEEMKHQGLVTDAAAWDDIQVSFLRAHQYFTTTARKTRQPKQDFHLQELLDKRR